MPLFAGLDIGTTHTKLVVCDHTCKVLFQQKKGYLKGYGATLDAAEILGLVTGLFRDLSDGGLIRGEQLVVSFSSAMHSLVLLDETFQPASPLYTWADTGSQPVVAALREDPAVRALFAETGTPFHPMSPFCKLAWMHRYHPGWLEKSSRAVGIKEFIWYHITGYWEVDHSIASATGLFSQLTLGWHPQALLLAGLPASKLSEPVPVTHQRSGMQPGFALASGLPPDTCWVIGGSDGCLAQLGSGVLHKGKASLTIGTSGAIRVTIPEFMVDAQGELFTYHLDTEHFVSGGAINNGGIVLQWWEQEILQHAGDPRAMLESFTAAAAAVSPGCDGLVCLPYFGGERAPVWDANASGVFAGIRTSHGQAHFKRAIIEGICFSFRQLLEKLEALHGTVDQVAVSGGFTASHWWVQLMADILQRPMLARDDTDASAMGAIAIAMKSTGQIRHWEQFPGLQAHTGRLYHPNAQTIFNYTPNYQRFLRLCQL